MLSLLAAGQLILLGIIFTSAVGKVTADGKVPVLDAGLFTAFLLSFQQTIGAIRSIWESQERTALAEAGQGPATPQDAKAAAGQVSDAAAKEAHRIGDKE